MRIIHLISALSMLLFISCDIIDKNDYVIDYLPPIPEGADVQRIVLEDYTGVRCNNCPLAAQQAIQLNGIYGDRLIVVAIHAGFFARPLDKNDFRTTDGTAYNTFWTINSYPQGIMNRRPFNGEKYYPFENWAAAAEAIAQRTSVGITAHTTYHPLTRAFDVTVDLTAYQGEGLPTEANLLLWLVEDNITSAQTMPDKTINPTYTQRHVFRGSLNGTWGEPLTELPALGVTSTINHTGYTLPDGYNVNNCSVVVLLTNPTSKEILQAVEVPIIATPE